MSKNTRSAPPGLDYYAISGTNKQLSFGVIQTQLPDGVGTTTAEKAAFRRLFPVQKPTDPALPWEKPTCAKWDVLLPPGASDEYLDPQHLVRSYDRHAFGVIRDLLIIITLRFPEVDASPPMLKLHEAWELSRGFALARLATARRLPVIPVLHVPGRAAKPGAPHVHLMTCARELLPSTFGKFCRELACEDGRQIMDQEWNKWREERGGV